MVGTHLVHNLNGSQKSIAASVSDVIHVNRYRLPTPFTCTDSFNDLTQ